MALTNLTNEIWIKISRLQSSHFICSLSGVICGGEDWWASRGDVWELKHSTTKEKGFLCYPQVIFHNSLRPSDYSRAAVSDLHNKIHCKSIRGRIVTKFDACSHNTITFQLMVTTVFYLNFPKSCDLWCFKHSIFCTTYIISPDLTLYITR